MEALINSMNLYDTFARLFVGIMTLITSEFLGVTDWISVRGNEENPNLLFVIAVSFFIGIVLEELSYLVDMFLSKTVEKNLIKKEEESHKAILVLNGFEHLVETPLQHIVMSTSLCISYVIFMIVELINRLMMPGLIRGNQLPCKINLITLLFFAALFYVRRLHYMIRRQKIIKRYYDAFQSKR